MNNGFCAGKIRWDISGNKIFIIVLLSIANEIWNDIRCFQIQMNSDVVKIRRGRIVNKTFYVFINDLGIT